MGITIKDIANALNVSTAAVSMALNNKKGVSTPLKIKIINYAKEHHYEFKEANSIVEQNGTILFLIFKNDGITFIDPTFFQELSLSIDVEAKKNNYYSSIKYLYADGNVEQQLKDIISLDVKGIIVLATEMEASDISYLSKIKKPIILLDATFIDCPYNSITQNNKQGAYLAIKHLIKQTNSQPGFLKASVEIHNFRQRKEGFFSTIQKLGYAKNDSQIIDLSPTIDGSYADMRDYLKKNKLTNKCYFADNDMIALGAMKAIKEAGYNIPKDISICGFDNLPYSSYTDPGLTSFEPNKVGMGVLAIKRLLEVIKGDELIIHSEVNVTLIKRSS